MTAFVCQTCDSGPIGPGEADDHEDRGHDVRRLPPERGQGAAETPPDAGHPEVFRGRRVGRRRSDY